jgi:MoxR-like ATPase
MEVPKLDIEPYLPIIDRLREVRIDLESFIFERESIIKAALIALLAKEHMLLLGPPGVAKSMVVNQLTRRIVDAQLFETLMTPFTTDRDLFVSRVDIHESSTRPSLKEWLKGAHTESSVRVVHHTEGNTLANAQLAFLDEIFKANDKTLFALLTLLNERKFDINRERHNAALMSAFFASNELPETDGVDGMAAFYDRILLRAPILPIKERENQVRVVTTQLAYRLRTSKGETDSMKVITLDEIQTLQSIVPRIYIPMEVINEAFDLAERISSELDIYVSLRRVERAFTLMQARALLGKRDTVRMKDLSVLRFVLWSEADQFAAVKKIVESVAYDPIETDIISIRDAAFEAIRDAENVIRSGNLWGSNLDEYIRNIEGARGTPTPLAGERYEQAFGSDRQASQEAYRSVGR